MRRLLAFCLLFPGCAENGKAPDDKTRAEETAPEVKPIGGADDLNSFKTTDQQLSFGVPKNWTRDSGDGENEFVFHVLNRSSMRIAYLMVRRNDASIKHDKAMDAVSKELQKDGFKGGTKESSSVGTTKTNLLRFTKAEQNVDALFIPSPQGTIVVRCMWTSNMIPDLKKDRDRIFESLGFTAIDPKKKKN